MSICPQADYENDPVASDRATFRAPELLRGIADTNYAQVLPRQIGPARARDMLMTGRIVTAAEAEAPGAGRDPHAFDLGRGAGR